MEPQQKFLKRPFLSTFVWLRYRKKSFLPRLLMNISPLHNRLPKRAGFIDEKDRPRSKQHLVLEESTVIKRTRFSRGCSEPRPAAARVVRSRFLTYQHRQAVSPRSLQRLVFSAQYR